MAKILKIIGLLVLALALWQTARDTFIGSVVDDGKFMTERTTDMSPLQEGAYITAPQLPYLPDAELAGARGQLQLLNSLRVQRSTATDCVFSLKYWVDMLAQREAILSLHREKLYDTTTYYRCHPACEYYIFTLRRILI